jgi:DNA-binding NtrC family response regulator
VEAMRRMEGYSWPGNVRELENVLTRAVVLTRDNVITPDLLGIPESGSEQAASAPQVPASPELISLDQTEARHVRAILEYTRWHKGKACEILGISRPALERKIEKYSLELPEQ